MDKTILIEYADAKEEIKDLRRRIEKEERNLENLNKTTVTDSVACGKKGKKPLHTVKIQGRPTHMIELKEKYLKKNINLLRALEADLLEKQTQAEEYIQKIPKSELRIMLRLYFIDDLPYYKVAIEMNRLFPKRKVKYTDENVKKRIQRFF